MCVRPKKNGGEITNDDNTAGSPSPLPDNEEEMQTVPPRHHLVTRSMYRERIVAHAASKLQLATQFYIWKVLVVASTTLAASYEDGTVGTETS